MRITLASARVNKKLTQEQLATVLGVSKKTVQNWESGKAKPRWDKIQPICEALEVNYDNINWQG